MKQSSNSRRTRGRGNGKRQSKNYNYDSNGPEGRVRGSAQQVYEKYLTLARDAQASGDRVATENYFQHAEHYFRILMAQEGNGDGRGESFRQRHNQFSPYGSDDDDEQGSDGDDDGGASDSGDRDRPQARESSGEAGAHGNNGRKIKIEKPASSNKASDEEGEGETSADDEGVRRTIAV